MSIPEIKEKCKYLTRKCLKTAKSKDFLTIIIIILVGVGSFGLGKLSEIERKNSPVIIQDESGNVVGRVGDSVSANMASAGNAKDSESAKVVASKSGTAYHLPWCSGASRIKEENKVWFSNKEEAEKAGYVPAKNCPGL